MRFQVIAIVFCSSILTSVAQLKGPDPTVEALRTRGTFELETNQVTGRDDFGPCTLYVPTDESQGNYSGVVVLPGLTNTREVTAGFSENLASFGFIVMNCNTLGNFDFPPARAEQLLAAERYLTTQSAVANRVNASRIGFAGYSMGGGGSLLAIREDPSILAAVVLAPYSTDKDFDSVLTPTLIIAGQEDSVANNEQHSLPFYQSLAGQKSYVEIAGGSHASPVTNVPLVSFFAIPWMKVFLDRDERFTPFICLAEPQSDLSDLRSSCNGSDYTPVDPPEVPDPSVDPPEVPDPSESVAARSSIYLIASGILFYFLR